MADLSPKQMIFVTEYLKDKNATQAAIRAGYSRKSAYSIGHQLLKKLEIQSRLNMKQTEVNRDLREMFAEEAHEAYKVLKKLMLKADSEMVQLNAAKDFLDRAGYKPVEKVVANVEVTEIVVDLPDELMEDADD